MLIIRCPHSRQPEREYIVRVILDEFLGVPYTLEWEDRTDVELTLAEDANACGGGKSAGSGKSAVSGGSAGGDGLGGNGCGNRQGDSGRRRLLFADLLLGIPEADWLAPSSLPQQPLAWKEAEGIGSMPVIYGLPVQEAPLLAEEGPVLRSSLDLFGSCFYMLTRYEELAIPERDGHGRFPATASLAYREGFLDMPIVNVYIEWLWSLLLRQWPGLTRKTRRFRRLISHDVDHPFLWHRRRSRASVFREALADALKRRDFEAAFLKAGVLTPVILPRRQGKVAAKNTKGQDPFNTFNWLMDQSERAGLCSSFYFIPEQADPAFDGTYSLDDPEIEALMRRIQERGHEIGIHPGYRTYLSGTDISGQFELLKRKAAAAGLRQEAWGGRQHFLRWQAPETWQHWENAGLSYDSSLGYSDLPGFRSGVCYEYPVFNLRTRKALQLRERPLVVMEQAVLGPGLGRDTTPEQAFETIRHYYEECARYNGDFTLLWHNSHLVHAAERKFYSRCLEELK